MHNTSTFREIAELWKENRRSVVKHSTYCAYALILKTHLMPVFADSYQIEGGLNNGQIVDVMVKGRVKLLDRKSVV